VQYCTTTNLTLKAECAAMAASLFREPFTQTIPHPQRLGDFASYSARSFCGPGSLFTDERKLSR